MPKGSIDLNKKTSGHQAWLTSHGYNAVVIDGRIVVDNVSEFISDIDLTQNPVEVLKDLVARKAALTYTTRALVEKDGERKVVFNWDLTRYLGKASALVMVPEKGAKKTKGSSVFDQV